MSAFESIHSTNGFVANHRRYDTYNASARRLPCTYVFPAGYCYRRTPSASLCGNTCKMIIGSVLGGLAPVCLAVLAAYHLRRRKTTRQPSTEAAHTSSTSEPGPAQPVPPPQQPMLGGSDYVGATGYPLATTQATDGVYGGGATYYARARAAEGTAAAFSASSSGYTHPEEAS